MVARAVAHPFSMPHEAPHQFSPGPPYPDFVIFASRRGESTVGGRGGAENFSVMLDHNHLTGVTVPQPRCLVVRPRDEDSRVRGPRHGIHPRGMVGELPKALPVRVPNTDSAITPCGCQEGTI